jgi:hypothetical protein
MGLGFFGLLFSHFENCRKLYVALYHQWGESLTVGTLIACPGRKFLIMHNFVPALYCAFLSNSLLMVLGFRFLFLFLLESFGTKHGAVSHQWGGSMIMGKLIVCPKTLPISSHLKIKLDKLNTNY